METTRSPGPPPLVIADRGASADAPEHTIAGFELALEQGADGIRLDVRLSADHHPVLARDFSLERTTDGSGPVHAHSMRELKRLDAGGWRGPGFRGQRIQTLAEMLERFRGRSRFWIEVPAGSATYPDIEERIVSTLEIYDVLGQTVVQSAEPMVLDRMRSLNREIALGLVVARAPLDAQILAGGSLHALCPSADMATEEALRRIGRSGLATYVWTVDEPARMDRLIEWGASGIVTGRPGLLRARLAG